MLKIVVGVIREEWGKGGGEEVVRWYCSWVSFVRSRRIFSLALGKSGLEVWERDFEVWRAKRTHLVDFKWEP
jgi:hypothetical protein